MRRRRRLTTRKPAARPAGIAAALSTTAFTNDNRGGDHQRDVSR